MSRNEVEGRTTTTATQTKVEQVARAIYEMDASNRGCVVDWSAFEWTPNMRKAFFPAARAVIAAMRVPTEAMITAYVDVVVRDGKGPRPMADVAPERWSAMIDAALAEGGSGKAG